MEKKVKEKKAVVEEEDKGGETPKTKPGKIVQTIEKNISNKVEKEKGKKGKDDDSDDPIA